jgi:hypothetical protein
MFRRNILALSSGFEDGGSIFFQMFNLHARLHDGITRRLQYESLMLSKLPNLYVKEILKSAEEILPTSQHVICFPWMKFSII